MEGDVKTTTKTNRKSFVVASAEALGVKMPERDMMNMDTVSLVMRGSPVVAISVIATVRSSVRLLITI